jgi:hypothetical protein
MTNNPTFSGDVTKHIRMDVQDVQTNIGHVVKMFSAALYF